MELLDALGFLNILLHYFKLYGYYLIFLALLLENIVIIGLFMPGETILLAASFFASQDHFNLTYVILTAIAGAFLGNNIGYFLGRRGGRPFIERFGEHFFISKEKIKEAEEYFDNHGGKTIFIGRFAIGIRVFLAPLAGASRMNYLKFFLYTVLSVIVWTLLISTLGYTFGEHWELLLRFLKRASRILLVIIVGLFFLSYYLRRRKRERKRE
ncbi:MAG: DedA family protein [Actinomycetota bacterium]|nr:DedA family protein [Actinomycetota bacterium]